MTATGPGKDIYQQGIDGLRDGSTIGSIVVNATGEEDFELLRRVIVAGCQTVGIKQYVVIFTNRVTKERTTLAADVPQEEIRT